MPFIVGALIGGAGGYAINHNPGSSHRPTAPASQAELVSDLEITTVQGGPDTVPCKPTVQGQGRVHQDMTAAVYAEDTTDHQKTHWYEPVSNFSDSGHTHWWVNIALKSASESYIVGVVEIPTQLASYLSTAEEWKDPTYTYWGSPGYPPNALVSDSTMTVTRTDQPC